MEYASAVLLSNVGNLASLTFERSQRTSALPSLGVMNPKPLATLNYFPYRRSRMPNYLRKIACDFEGRPSVAQSAPLSVGI